MDSDYSDDEYAPITLASWGDQKQQSGSTTKAEENNKNVVVDWHSLADPSAKVKSGTLGSGGLHRRGPNYKPVDEEYILKQRLNGQVPKQLKIKALREAEKKVEGNNRDDKKSNKKSSSSSSASFSSKKKYNSTSPSSSATAASLRKNSNKSNHSSFASSSLPATISKSSPSIPSSIRRPPPPSSSNNNAWGASSLVETPFWEQSSTTTTTNITNNTSNSFLSTSALSLSSLSSSNDQHQQQQNKKISSTPPGFENNIKSSHNVNHKNRSPPGFQQQNKNSFNNININNNNGWDQSSASSDWSNDNESEWSQTSSNRNNNNNNGWDMSPSTSNWNDNCNVNNNKSWLDNGWGNVNHQSSSSSSKWSNNNKQPSRFSDPSKNKYSGTDHSPFPKNYYKKDGATRPAFIESPNKVASPPISHNPIVVSVHLELDNNMKVPVNIHKLDDPSLLAKQFAQSQNIKNPKVIQAITQLFIQQKDRAMQRYTQK